MMFCGNSPTHRPSASSTAVGAGGSGPSRNLVRRGCGELPLLRTQGVCVSRSGTCSRRSQGGEAHQVYGTYVSPGLCAIPACCRRQDRVPTHLTHRSLVSNPEDNRGQSFRRFRSSSNISKLHFDWTEKSATRRCALCPRSRPTGHNRLATSLFFLQ